VTAEEIQAYFLELVAPALEREYRAQYPHSTVMWYVGSCDCACGALEDELGPDLLLPFLGGWGGYDDGPIKDSHYFLYDGAGTIVDPTSAQYGLEPCAIIRRGTDPRFAHYVLSERLGD
jgi:hypothetical protein